MSVPFKRKRINMRAPLTFSWNNFQNKSGDLMRFRVRENERAIQNLQNAHETDTSKSNRNLHSNHSFEIRNIYLC